MDKVRTLTAQAKTMYSRAHVTVKYPTLLEINSNCICLNKLNKWTSSLMQTFVYNISSLPRLLASIHCYHVGQMLLIELLLGLTCMRKSCKWVTRCQPPIIRLQNKNMYVCMFNPRRSSSNSKSDNNNKWRKLQSRAPHSKLPCIQLLKIYYNLWMTKSSRLLMLNKNI